MPCERRAPAFEGEAAGKPCAAESMSLKKLTGFFDSDMLQLFDFELRPDQMIPFDWDAL
jgi:hypothetical protein